LGKFLKSLCAKSKGYRFGIVSMSRIIAKLPQLKPMLKEVVINQSSPLCTALFRIVCFKCGKMEIVVSAPLLRKPFVEEVSPTNGILSADEVLKAMRSRRRIIHLAAEPKENPMTKNVAQIGITVHRLGIKEVLKPVNEQRAPMTTC
jgi:hypothetical protein